MEPFVSINDFCAQEALCRELKLDPVCLRLLRSACFKRAASLDEALAGLESPVAERLAARIVEAPIEVVRRLDSARDRVTKLALRTAGGHVVEMVLMRIASGRTSLCVSTQTGCAIGCIFCATGRRRPAEDLSGDEILAQVHAAGRMLREEDARIRNVVFMGMGEPLLNESAVHRAIEVLLAPQGFGLSPRRVLVSTVGVPDAMRRLAAAFPNVGLAVSLHAARQTIRRRLIPAAQKWPLDLVRKAIVDLAAAGTKPIMIEYLMLAGVNDASEDLDALEAWLEGLPVHVNLIPYNRPPLAVGEADAGLGPSPRETLQRFAQTLRTAGHPTTIRYSQGQDIAAACGQLAPQESLQSPPRDTRLW